MVGQPLYGYCGGWFGRDSYRDKRVEAVGVDWVVARDEGGEAHCAIGHDVHESLMQFTIKPEEDW